MHSLLLKLLYQNFLTSCYVDAHSSESIFPAKSERRRKMLENESMENQF